VLNVAYRGVTKKFGETVAVDNLTLDISAGEFLVLVGPSGCGKSTTLRLLAGLEVPDSGELVIGDRVMNNVPAKDRDIAMVFQSYALYPHMTAFDNMAFSLKLRRLPKAEIQERVSWVGEMLGISNLLRRRPKELSGGEQQRVALGRAVVRKPAVFLMDEPLSNLDAKLRVEARELLIDLHHRLEATFIYVTHDQVEALVMADRLVVMNHGRLEQVGTPQGVLKEPASPFVARFVGETIGSLVQLASGWEQ
jgi:multiple sugar transport system ATP-binding protein